MKPDVAIQRLRCQDNPYQPLAVRNKARYDRHATVGKTEAEFVMELAEEMIQALARIL